MAATDWERRFRAPVVSFPDWSPQAPDRVAFASNESGIWQMYALDLSTLVRRRVTNHPVGVTDGTPSVDGSHVVWFQDETGDESGRWFCQAFEGGEDRPFLQDVPAGWNEGLALAADVTAAIISGRDGFVLYVAAGKGTPTKELYRSTEAIQFGRPEYAGAGFNRAALSPDGELLALEHSEHGDLIHPALRVVEARTGDVVGELHDKGMTLHASCWSPVPGDRRLAIVHERTGWDRPAIWDLRTGELLDLDVRDLPGGVVRAEDWWPDASAVLLVSLDEGREGLYRYELASGELTQVLEPRGLVPKARVRPDGGVWLLQHRSDVQPLALDEKGNEVVAPRSPDGRELGEDERAPRGRPYRSWYFENPHGQRVHGFYVTPEQGDVPYPVMMLVHGGPTSLDLERWEPDVQAYVDAGFAVGMVNYRGSVGYGREWRDALIGDVGGPELEDVNAGLADLVRRGIGDPSRAVIAGWSWGGYITLLELGKHPELWICGVAGVPVGDYEDGYEELSPLLQAYDRALLGGTPREVPELMRERNPIHFADNVRAPVLFIVGENDTRCPYRQAMRYVERLRARGHPHEVYTYRTGHSSFDIEERIRQVGVALTFLRRHVSRG